MSWLAETPAAGNVINYLCLVYVIISLQMIFISDKDLFPYNINCIYLQYFNKIHHKTEIRKGVSWFKRSHLCSTACAAQRLDDISQTCLIWSMEHILKRDHYLLRHKHTLEILLQIIILTQVNLPVMQSSVARDAVSWYVSCTSITLLEKSIYVSWAKFPKLIA